MWNLFWNWLGADRIRVPNQTGRLGRLVVGDQLLWQEIILEVKERSVVYESETESEVLLVLEGVFETPIVRYELSLAALALPRACLVGRIRSVDDRSKSNEIEVGNDDIVLLARKKSLPCLID
jgi:hypothetical protein